MANNDPRLPGDGGKQIPASGSGLSSTDSSAIDEQPTIPTVPVVEEQPTAPQSPIEGDVQTAGSDKGQPDETAIPDLPTMDVPVVQEQSPSGSPSKQDEEIVQYSPVRTPTGHPRHGLGKTALVKVGQEKKGNHTNNAAPVIAGGNNSHKLAPVIAVRDLTKTYILGRKTQVPALRGVSLEVYPGEFVAIMGPSGSGKSTFMNLIGCLDRPTQGEYWLAGRLVSRLSNDELASMRNQLIGFVFQGFNLLGRATAIKNVALPAVYAGLSRREREQRARKLLQLVGLGGRVDHKPSELSGGQQQRVAIARSLINGPSLLLADEPTGNLDSRTSIEIMGVLQALNEQGLTIVLVTHDSNVAAYAKRQVAFLDGRIVRDEPVLAPRSAQAEWEALVNKDAIPAAGTTVVKEESK